MQPARSIDGHAATGVWSQLHECRPARVVPHPALSGASHPGRRGFTPRPQGLHTQAAGASHPGGRDFTPRPQGLHTLAAGTPSEHCEPRTLRATAMPRHLLFGSCLLRRFVRCGSARTAVPMWLCQGAQAVMRVGPCFVKHIRATRTCTWAYGVAYGVGALPAEAGPRSAHSVADSVSVRCVHRTTRDFQTRGGVERGRHSRVAQARQRARGHVPHTISPIQVVQGGTGGRV